MHRMQARYTRYARYVQHMGTPGTHTPRRREAAKRRQRFSISLWLPYLRLGAVKSGNPTRFVRATLVPARREAAKRLIGV